MSASGSVSDACHPASAPALTIVRKGSAVLELLSGKDKSLLVGRDTLLVLDLGLDVVDSVGRLDLKGDRLSGQSDDKSARRIRSTSGEMMDARGQHSRLDENLHCDAMLEM